MKKFIKAVLYLPILPFSILLILFSPIFYVRFGILPSERIGHFSCIVELYLCELDLSINKKKLDFFCCSGGHVSNSQVKKFWERKIKFFPKRLLFAFLFWLRILPYGKKHDIFESKSKIEKLSFFMHRDKKNLIDDSKIHCTFLPEEERINLKSLERIGIDVYKKFAVIFARDNFYFEKYHPKYDNSRLESKNVDINSFVMSIRYLIESGYQVIRVGKGSFKEANINDHHYFDITNHNLRTDSLEMYLISKCNIFLGTNSGLSYLATFLFKKPCFITNHLPYGTFHSESKLFQVNFKKLIDINTGKVLSISEIYKKKLFFDERTSVLKNNKVFFEDQQESEIKSSLLEFIKKIEDDFIKEKDEVELEQLFLKNIFSYIDKDPIFKHYYGKPKCSFGKNYLLNNPYLFN